jgi:hypothetical protein
MKLYAMTAWTAMALSAPFAFAQTQTQTEVEAQTGSTQTQVEAQTSTAQPQAGTAAQTPEPIVVETTVDLTTDDPGPPADPRAAREEAINALDWAKKEGCRSEGSRSAQRECVQRAQDEYQRVMAELPR